MPISGPTEVRALAEDVNALSASVHAELAERRRAEANAQLSEASYRLLFQGNPSPMYVYDVEHTRFVAVNDAALALYGYTREEFIGMAVEELIAPRDADRLKSSVSNVRSGRYHGLSNPDIWRYRRRDGSEFDVEVTANDHSFEGRAAGVVLALDVTERVEAERLLRVSEARYRDLFENASDLIATVDLNGRMTDVNEAFIAATGYSRDELLQLCLEDLIPAESRAALERARTQKLAGASETIYEHELLAKDGTRIQLEVASRLIFEDGRPVGTEAICRDISERKQLEEQLRQAQKMEAVGRLAGGVAHDFNNLLTVISGYADAAARRPGPGRPAPETSTRSHGAGRARGGAHPPAARLQPPAGAPSRACSTSTTSSRDLTPMLARLIGEDIELATQHSRVADPGCVGRPGPDRAGAREPGRQRARRDAGGRAAHDRDGQRRAGRGVRRRSTPRPCAGPLRDARCQRHRHGHGRRDAGAHLRAVLHHEASRASGTGLGLATVYGIVKQSGGHMWVYSEPGHGHDVQGAPAACGFAGDRRGGSARRCQWLPAATETILLVEDEESLKRLTARILENHGYEVIAAETAMEAVEIAARNGRTIHLLLTDLVMPELSGTALAERVCELRSRRPRPLHVGIRRRRRDAERVADARISLPREAVQRERARRQGARDARRGLTARLTNRLPPARPRCLHDHEPFPQLVRDRLERACPDHHRTLVLLDLVALAEEVVRFVEEEDRPPALGVVEHVREVLLRLPDVLRNDLGDSDHGDSCVRACRKQLLQLVHL